MSGEVATRDAKNRFAMFNDRELTIDVPHFDLPVILAFNAVLWVPIIAFAAAVF